MGCYAVLSVYYGQKDAKEKAERENKKEKDKKK